MLMTRWTAGHRGISGRKDSTAEGFVPAGKQAFPHDSGRRELTVRAGSRQKLNVPRILAGRSCSVLKKEQIPVHRSHIFYDECNFSLLFPLLVSAAFWPDLGWAGQRPHGIRAVFTFWLLYCSAVVGLDVAQPPRLGLPLGKRADRLMVTYCLGVAAGYCGAALWDCDALMHDAFHLAAREWVTDDLHSGGLFQPGISRLG